jgi:molybdopterin molybdotransferase
MISQSEAHDIMMARARTLESESVGLDAALNRVLAEDVRSDMHMPPFVKSAMDGYACRREDLAKHLNVIEYLKAGEVPQKTIGPGECSKVMTGGMLPEGADCVVMVEKSEELGGDAVRFTTDSTPDNFCLKGEDIQEGEVVLTTGTLLRPQHIAMLASVGCVQPQVARQPRVGVIATGDELVEPDVTPDISQIRTSNSHQLVAQVRTALAIPTYYGIARDTVESLDATLKKAMSESDIVLLSGGVSMGDFDLVPGIMKANGLEILFDEIAVQPGKPTTFAVSEDLYCVGLPGNPVATFTQFEHLVKPLIHRLMGHDHRPLNLRLPMARKHTRRRAVRESWFLAKITDEGAVLPCEFHGSAHVNAMCEAHVLATMPVGVASLDEGELVTVRTL